MLARQAGFDLEFRFEDQALPDARFYILPCVAGVTGMPKQRWEQILAKVREGATLYTSSNNGYYLNFAEATGLTVLNRSRRTGPAAVTLDSAAGPVELQLQAAFRLDYQVDRAEVLAREADGNPVLSRADYGQGQVFYCALPIELDLVKTEGLSEQPEAQPLWRIYETISARARARRVLSLQEPHVGLTEHALDDGSGRLAVLVNHSPQARKLSVALQAGWMLGEVLYGEPAEGCVLQIGANEALVLRLNKV